MSVNVIKVNNSDANYTHSIFDISEYHLGQTYENLSAALQDVPQDKQISGMTVRFVQTSWNKYVQYRLMSDTWSVDTENWAISDEGVYVEDSKFISVELDSENKLISGRKINGTKIENVGFETPLLRIEDVTFESTDNPEFISAKLDYNGKILEATTKDCKTVYCDFQAKNVSAKNLTANEVVSSIIKTQNLKLNGFADIELKKTMGLMPIDQTDSINAFVSLVRNATGLIESFVFFSDPHLFVNYNKGEYDDSKIQYLDKISKYFRSTPTDFVLCGGDWLNAHKQSAAADALSWIDSFANKSFNS